MLYDVQAKATIVTYVAGTMHYEGVQKVLATV